MKSNNNIFKELKHLITIWDFEEKIGPDGHMKVTWFKMCNTWAKIEALQDWKHFKLLKRGSIAQYKVTIRFGIVPKMNQKISFNRAEYFIVGVTPDLDKKNYITLIVEQRK